MTSTQMALLAVAALGLYLWSAGRIRLPAARPAATTYAPSVAVAVAPAPAPGSPLTLEEMILLHALRGSDLHSDKEASDRKARERMAAALALRAPPPDPPKG